MSFIEWAIRKSIRKLEETKIDYSDEGEFNDPIVRCYECAKLVHRIWLAERGGCNHCGARRVKRIMNFKEEEMKKILDGTADFNVGKDKWFPVDPDFLTLFKEEEEI